MENSPEKKKKGGCLKTFVIIVIGGLVLLVVIGKTVGGKNQQAGDPHSSESAPVADAPTETFKIGDTVKFDDSQWTVLEARSLGSRLTAEFAEPKTTEGKFVYVKFKLVNTTSEEESILFTPALKDSKGRSFKELDDLEIYLDGEKGMMAEQLPSSLPKTFSAIYEVPADASDLSFMARSLGFAGKEKAVRLGF